MKYEILEAPGVHPLEEMVNEMLDNGWELQGGLCSTKYGRDTYYSQAMIKRDEVTMNVQDAISCDFEALATIFSKYK